MSEKGNYFMREPGSAAGNSRSRRSAAPSVRIRGRELTLEAVGRTFCPDSRPGTRRPLRILAHFFTTKYIISQKSAKFHFFSENCSGILRIFPPQGQKSSPSGSFSGSSPFFGVNCKSCYFDLVAPFLLSVKEQLASPTASLTDSRHGACG